MGGGQKSAAVPPSACCAVSRDGGRGEVVFLSLFLQERETRRGLIEAGRRLVGEGGCKKSGCSLVFI